MKIAIDDHAAYVDKVHAMIEYFDILDSAGTESEDLSVHEVPLRELREDRHVPFDGRLIDCLNSYRGTYVRAPSMPQRG